MPVTVKVICGGPTKRRARRSRAGKATLLTTDDAARQLGELGNDHRASFEAVENLRRQAGISQAELARTAGLSEATYNKLVNDSERVPFRRTVLKLREAVLSLATGARAA